MSKINFTKKNREELVYLFVDYTIMKKLLLFFMFSFCFIVNAQTISFSDSNFKNRLIASNSSNGFAKDTFGNGIVVDTNSDSEIQVSEALNVYELYFLFLLLFLFLFLFLILGNILIEIEFVNLYNFYKNTQK